MPTRLKKKKLACHGVPLIPGEFESSLVYVRSFRLVKATSCLKRKQIYVCVFECRCTHVYRMHVEVNDQFGGLISLFTLLGWGLVSAAVRLSWLAGLSLSSHLAGECWDQMCAFSSGFLGA